MTIHRLGSDAISQLLTQQIAGMTSEDSVQPEASGAVGAAEDSYVAPASVVNDPNEYARQIVNITKNGTKRVYTGSLLDDIAFVFGGNVDFIEAFTTDFDAWLQTDTAKTLIGYEAPDLFDVRFQRGKLDYEACVYVGRALQSYVVSHRAEMVEQLLATLFDPAIATDPAVASIDSLVQLWPDFKMRAAARNDLSMLKESQKGTVQVEMLAKADVVNFINAVLAADEKAPPPTVEPFIEIVGEQNLTSGNYLPPDREAFNQAYAALSRQARVSYVLAAYRLGQAAVPPAVKGPISGELSTTQGYQAGYVFEFSGAVSGMWPATKWAKLGGTVGFSAEQGKSAYERTADYPFEVPTGGSVNLVPQLSVDASLWSKALTISAGVVPDLTKSGSGLGIAVSGSVKPGDGTVTVTGGVSGIKPVAWGADLKTTDPAVSTQMGVKGVFGAAGREEGKELVTGSINYLTYNDGKTVHFVPISVAVRPLAALGISGGWTGIFFPGGVFKQKITGSVGWDFDSLTLSLDILYASKTSPVSFDDPLGESWNTEKIDTGMKVGPAATWQVSGNVSLGAEIKYCSSHLGEEGLHTATANGLCGAANAKVTF